MYEQGMVDKDPADGQTGTTQQQELPHPMCVQLCGSHR